MERTANEIQKERRKEIEDKADENLSRSAMLQRLLQSMKKDTRVFVYCLLQRQKNFQMFTL